MIGDWMQTRHGRAFWPLDPRAEDVHVLDIAHSLSLLCRFNGHCREFYSVAQHSILVADILKAAGAPPLLQLRGLLHDAHEAYLGDVIRPLGRYVRFEAEGVPRTTLTLAAFRVQGVIEDALLGHAAPLATIADRDAIHVADVRALATERRDLMLHVGGIEWSALDGIDPRPEEIVPDPPGLQLAQTFVEHFNALRRDAGLGRAP